MKSKNSQSGLQEKINELKKMRDDQRTRLFNTSDQTRANLTSLQNTLYFTQIAIGVFKNLTNYHVPVKRRLKNTAITIGSILLTEIMRRRFSKQKDTPKESQ